MKQLQKLFIYLFLILQVSCATTRPTSTLYSDKYDEQTDQTVVMIFPYGEVKMPGKWTRIADNAISGQIFFMGIDSVKVAVALEEWDRYEFSHNNREVTQENFVRKFYEWDSAYLKVQTNGQVNVLKENKEKNYLVWKIESERTGVDYFLFGLKGNIAYNLNIKTEKWDEEKKTRFLEQLFNP